MGKKNRRKNVNKKERKEQLEVRRERLHEVVDRQDEEEEDDNVNESKEDIPLEVGDRVFYIYGGVGDHTRGIVTKTSDTLDDLAGSVLVQPVDEKYNPGFYPPVDCQDVIRDTQEWTTRFQLGDKVLCNGFSGVWEPATISQRWPIDAIDGIVSPYTCQKSKGGSNAPKYFAVPDDSDEYVMKHPQSFRFSVEDEVTFDSDKAVGLPKRNRESWIRGKVTKVDITGRADYYATYECSYVDRKRTRTCHILKDDDEHIANLAASPRERLLEAIEQDCSYAHFDYLVKSSGLDVMAFQDLLLSKLIQNANYHVLLWLQENAGVDLARIRDDDGNGLLHQIAKSPRAERFFIEAAQKEMKNDDNQNCEASTAINFNDLRVESEERLFRQTNSKGRTFLHELILSGNKRALDLVLSPRRGLAWCLAMCYIDVNFSSTEPLSNVHTMSRDKSGMNLKDTARLLGRFEMEKMVDEFAEWHLLFELSFRLESLRTTCGKYDLPDSVAISKFGEGGTASTVAQHLIRFLNKWDGNTSASKRSNMSVENAIVSLCRVGRYGAVSWLIDADPSLLKATESAWSVPPDPAEFTQPTGTTRSTYNEGELDLVEFTTLGINLWRADSFDDDCRNIYTSMLGSYRASLKRLTSLNEDCSFVEHIRGQVEPSSHNYLLNTMLEEKLCLLQDDETLVDRLKVLDYLVKDRGMPPPTVLSIIRWRQCGVLRWMVENSFIYLQKTASENEAVIGEGKKLKYLGGKTIPRTMTIGAFLCFAAIEFDDLQSFEWLVQNQGIALSSIVLNGLNVMHCCASFGRAEIVLWLMQSQSQSTLTSLLEEECTQPPWNGYFAAHIAAEKGYTFLSDVLLSMGCPKEAISGKSVINIAKKSSLQSVRAWASKKEKPMQLEKDVQRLEKDVQRLLHLLSSEGCSIDDIKRHLLKSKCMDYTRWINCDYNTVDEAGPLGKSYREILELSCRFDDPDYVVWLCQELCPSTGLESNYRREYLWDRFWKYHETFEPGCLDVTALLQFTSKTDNGPLRKALSSSWAKDIRCDEPSERNHVLKTMQLCLSQASSAHIMLKKFRDQLLQIDILDNVMERAMREVNRLFVHGGKGFQIGDVITAYRRFANERARLQNAKVEDYYDQWGILSSDGSVNLEGHLDSINYGDDHPLRDLASWRTDDSINHSNLLIILATEGHCELIKWVRSVGKSEWNAEQEISTVRITAYMGHTEIVDYFLRRKPLDEFRSKKSDRYQAAVLGAANAGRTADVKAYIEECEEGSFVSENIVAFMEFDSATWSERSRAFASSLAGTVVFGCLHISRGDRRESPLNSKIREDHLAVLKLVILEGYTDAKTLLEAVALYISIFGRRDLGIYDRCYGLIGYLVNDMSVDVSRCHEGIIRISKGFLELVSDKSYETNFDQEGLLSLVERWLMLISNLGVDIQQLKCDAFYCSSNEKRAKKLAAALPSAQAEQLRTWSQFDPIKEGGSLEDVKDAAKNGDIDLSLRCRMGFLATHLAAAYDRVDVLQWLVEDKNMALDACDTCGRNVLQVAKDSDARTVSHWIELNTAGNVIAMFGSSHFRRRRALQNKETLLSSIMTIQAWQRGHIVRRTYRGRLLSRLDEVQRFQEIWGSSIALLSACSVSGNGEDWTWQTMKQREHDIMQADYFVEDEDMMADTAQRLGEAANWALSATDVSNENSFDVSLSPSTQQDNNDVQAVIVQEEEEELPSSCCLQEMHHSVFSRIKMTCDVVKWLRRSDNKYRDFFVRRIKQLAAGDRSRILAKRLTGSKTLIYETYLEQKSGHRILWTESEGDSLLIWYVAKHKNVSRLMSLIDDAENRSSRQLTSATTLSEINGGDASTLTADEQDSDQIMLDPRSDTPLKLYEVSPDEIEKLSDPTWKPRLYLTTREREVVETGGTVLLLGRSGTGKTCVIGNRMDYDRQRVGINPGFSQLFVARSKGLCDYVKEAVDGGDQANMSFETFGEVVSSLEEALSSVSNGKNEVFLPSSKMDFRRFQKEFCLPDSSSGNVDALVVWTNIRSFIKGSIEALQSPDKILSEEEYLNLGKKRCRLSLQQRKFVYSRFERYNTYLTELGLWDDCDRITALVGCLDEARKSDLHAYQEVRYNKLYVDEVQDYTQAEIALFFYLCGPGDLFLAGDPAQSVVEGVEFRFEEIRSVGYHLYGEERRHLIPDKPKTVHVNFRSHCGILNVAAAVLSCLFEAFPDSAKELKEDRGLFLGPRPGVFHKVTVPRLAELVSKRNGIVVLTHDRNVSKWKQALGDYPLVYGIREAKGLEFQEVILVDFFRDILVSLQKLWRDLLLGRDIAGMSLRPEIEGHLKLLYTATTRCIQRLYFAETSSSVAGDAFVRWLTTTTTTRRSTTATKDKEVLAVKSNVEDVEKMARTPDEWRSAGLDNAVMAESAHELSEKEKWLDRALYCFEQVGDSELASRARTHRLSIQFQQVLNGDDPNEEDATEMEIRAALLTEQLLAERLLSEARDICYAILPLLGDSAQEMLQDRLVAQLPSENTK